MLVEGECACGALAACGRLAGGGGGCASHAALNPPPTSADSHAEEKQGRLFRLVSAITGFKNSLKGAGYFLGAATVGVR